MTTDRFCITQVAATIDALLGVPGHGGMAAPLLPVLQQAARSLTGVCDRVFLYNPDAIAQWIYAGHRPLFAPLEVRADLGLGMLSVYPPVTPACFASMYSGLQPAVHGIQSYVKPVLTVDTVFDDLPQAGRRVAIVSTEGDSISLIFGGRDVDYFIFPTVAQCNRKALELIQENRHHLIVLYNGNYDHWMHRGGPETPWSLHALKANISTYCALHDAIRQHWRSHNAALAFAPDHGCHRQYGLLGQHGIDAPCDMHIRHFWRFFPAQS